MNLDSYVNYKLVIEVDSDLDLNNLSLKLNDPITVAKVSEHWDTNCKWMDLSVKYENKLLIVTAKGREEVLGILLLLSRLIKHVIDGYKKITGIAELGLGKEYVIDDM
jgi:hypothetical protein